MLLFFHFTATSFQVSLILIYWGEIFLIKNWSFFFLVLRPPLEIQCGSPISRFLVINHHSTIGPYPSLWNSNFENHVRICYITHRDSNWKFFPKNFKEIPIKNLPKLKKFNFRPCLSTWLPKISQAQEDIDERAVNSYPSS